MVVREIHRTITFISRPDYRFHATMTHTNMEGDEDV